MGVFKLGGMTLKSLFKKAPTRKYPIERREPFERTRGHIDMADIESCILCGLCSKKCPALAIKVERDKKTWTYFPYKCIFCSSCVHVCPKSCLVQEKHYPAVTTNPQAQVHKKPELTPQQKAEKTKN